MREGNAFPYRRILINKEDWGNKIENHHGSTTVISRLNHLWMLKLVGKGLGRDKISPKLQIISPKILITKGKKL